MVPLAFMAKPATKFVFIGIAIVAVLGLMWGYGKYAERVGRLESELDHAEAAEKMRVVHQSKQRDLVIKLREALDDETIIIKEKIRIVREDPSLNECFKQADLPDTVLRDFGGLPNDANSPGADTN